MNSSGEGAGPSSPIEGSDGHVEGISMKVEALNQVHEGFLVAESRLVGKIGPPLGLLILGHVQAPKQALDITEQGSHFKQR